MNMQSYVLPKSFGLRLCFKILKYSVIVILIIGIYRLLPDFLWGLSSDMSVSQRVTWFLGKVLIWGLVISYPLVIFLVLSYIRLEMTEQGITVSGWGYKMYTPWHNLGSIGSRGLLLGKSRGIFLKEKAVTGMSIEEGKQRNMAVLVTDIRASLLLLTLPSDFLSLDHFVSKRSEYNKKNEFWSYMKCYAPQLFKQEK